MQWLPQVRDKEIRDSCGSRTVVMKCVLDSADGYRNLHMKYTIT